MLLHSRLSLLLINVDCDHRTTVPLCTWITFNVMDRYAVAVKNNDTVIGHLPKKVSRICYLFLWKGEQPNVLLLEQGGTQKTCHRMG